MTPREIRPEDVRVGDKVEVRRLSFTITGIVAEVDANHERRPLRFGGETPSADVVWPLIKGATITLLDRPLPPVPTDAGTVIRSKLDNEHVLVRGTTYWVALSSGMHQPRDWVPTRDRYDVLVPDATP